MAARVCHTGAMDPATYLAAIDRDGRAVLDAGKAGVDAPVPTCEGWTVGDVLGHLGRVHRSVADIVERRARTAPSTPVPAAPQGDAVVGFYEEGWRRMHAALAAVDPDEPVYTWSDDQRVGFYLRRMAHELAIHRVDAELAHGEPGELDADLAVDAIDELFEVVLPFSVRRRGTSLPAGSLHLHRTDGDGEWLVRTEDDRLVVTHEHAKGDAAVRGAAGDLLLFVWNRGRPERLQVFGDEHVAAEWARLAP